MPTRRPVPPTRSRPVEAPKPTEAVNPEPPSPEPSVQSTDLAAMLKKAKARLAEAEKRIRQAAESRTTSTAKDTKAQFVEPETPPPAEPQVEPAAAAGNTETPPVEAEAPPPVEPQAEPVVAARAPETPPAEPEAPPPVEPQAEPVAAARDVETRPAEPEIQPTADPGVAHAAMLKDMEARLIEAEKHAKEHHDAWLRAKAETENMRRRAQEDTAKASKFAAEKFAGAMLPVKDSLEAALAIEGQTLEKMHEGVELTLKQLIGAFESASLAEENPLGQKFDPNKHQAIGVIESEGEPNTVIHVLQKGYLLHGRVIRPAMVMVSKAKT